MDISNIYKFEADNVVSIVSGARCSLGKAVDIKHGRENCEETQQLRIIKQFYYIITAKSNGIKCSYAGSYLGRDMTVMNTQRNNYIVT